MAEPLAISARLRLEREFEREGRAPRATLTKPRRAIVTCSICRATSCRVNWNWRACCLSIARTKRRARLKARGEQAAGVLRTVEAFLGALRERRGPRGALALRPGYNNNLNQSSASRTCLLAAPNGVCLLERTIPAPIAALGLNFEGRAGLRAPLVGHHGLSLRAVA